MKREQLRRALALSMAQDVRNGLTFGSRFAVRDRWIKGTYNPDDQLLKEARCGVCVLGALFLALMERTDPKITFQTAFRMAYTHLPESSYPEGLYPWLLMAFDRTQLLWLEMAYLDATDREEPDDQEDNEDRYRNLLWWREVDELGWEAEDRKVRDQAYQVIPPWVEAHKDLTDNQVLFSILSNIIQHKGKFNPKDLTVRAKE